MLFSPACDTNLDVVCSTILHTYTYSTANQPFWSQGNIMMYMQVVNPITKTNIRRGKLVTQM